MYDPRYNMNAPYPYENFNNNFYKKNNMPNNNMMQSDTGQYNPYDTQNDMSDYTNNNPYQQQRSNPYTAYDSYTPYAEGGFVQQNENDAMPQEGIPQELLASMPQQDMPQQDYPNIDMSNSMMPQENMLGDMGQEDNPLPSLAEIIRQQGIGTDTILAHINPQEAQMLGEMTNGGSVNPVTNLPQFGLFSNPKKWFQANIGPGLGAIVGNMILPGVGGVIGGALGGAGGSFARGRKDYMQSALRGGAMGAMLPSAAGLLGGAANSMGATGLGSSLTNYGNTNAILPALGLGGSSSAAGTAGATGLGSQAGLAQGGAANASGGLAQYSSVIPGTDTVLASNIYGGAPAASAAAPGASQGFFDSLTGNMSNYLAKPENLLTLGAAAGSFLGREKPKTPEQLAEEYKRQQNALRLTPAERAQREADLTSDAQMQRRIARNKFLPEEKLNINPIHKRTHTPEEFKQSGRWHSYYDTPDFSGQGRATPFKEGGSVHPEISYEIEKTMYPVGMGTYINGTGLGQVDKVKAALAEGEYVMPSDVVAHLGDGNNLAGAKQFDRFILNIRKHKTSGKGLPPKAKSLIKYMEA